MNVLITRPDERGQQLVEMLAEQGIFAIHQPLFRLEAGQELPLLPAVLGRLNPNDYVFAVSKHAITYAHKALTEVGFHWRSDLHYFAVGQTSANYFASHIEQAVHYPIKFENSEGLLELPEMQDLAGKNIVILRANTGRDYFPEQATERGANIQCLECYQRIALTENIGEQLSLCKRAGIDTIVSTSVEMLQALVEQTAAADQKWLVDCCLLVVSPRMAYFAQKLGWQPSHIRIAAKADNQSLFTALLTQF